MSSWMVWEGERRRCALLLRKEAARRVLLSTQPKQHMVKSKGGGYECGVERVTRWTEDAPSSRRGNIGMYTCVHLQGYRRDRMLSAQEVSREYWEDTKATCRSLSRRENKSTTCSRERHSNRGVMGIVDQALGSLEGGRLNNTFSVPMK